MAGNTQNADTSAGTNMRRGIRQMLIPTIIMAVLAIVFTVIAYNRGGGEHITGLKSAGSLLLQIIPLLIFAFIVAGMIQLRRRGEIAFSTIFNSSTPPTFGCNGLSMV